MVYIWWIIVSIIMIHDTHIHDTYLEEVGQAGVICIIIIGVVSVHMQYNCVYYYDT
jgi:hypothetical protein